MDDFHYQRLLNDPSNFSQAGAVHCLDISIYHDSAEDTIHHRQTSEHDLLESLPHLRQNDTAPALAKFQLIATTEVPRGRLPHWEKNTVPLHRRTFVKVTKCLRLSKVFLATVVDRIVAYTEQRVIESENGEATESLRFVFQTPASSTFDFTLALTFHPGSLTTTALLLGLQENMVLDMISRLKHAKRLISAPMLLPILLVEMNIATVQRRISMAHKGLSTITYQTNLRDTASMPAGAHERANKIDDAERDAEIVTISRDLIRISAKLAKSIYVCDVLIQICQYLQEAGPQCVTSLTRDSPTSRRRENAIQSNEAVQNIIVFNIRWIHSTHSKAIFFSRKADAYVQTVYSLIAQRDNATNTQITQASIQIAEASRFDNLAMKDIAEATKQDSSTMLTIAILTTLFLPPTYIATLFSTSFFNFQAADGRPTVSKWIWIYVLISVVLTAMVQVVWVLYARRGNLTYREGRVSSRLSTRDVGAEKKAS